MISLWGWSRLETNWKEIYSKLRKASRKWKKINFSLWIRFTFSDLILQMKRLIIFFRTKDRVIILNSKNIENNYSHIASSALTKNSALLTSHVFTALTYWSKYIRKCYWRSFLRSRIRRGNSSGRWHIIICPSVEIACGELSSVILKL